MREWFGPRAAAAFGRSVEIVYDYKLRKRRRRPVSSESREWIFPAPARVPSRGHVTGSRAGCRFLRLGDDTAAPSTMGLYSKGTRSKGVTKTFQKQGQANTVQRSRHEKRDAFLAKEAFMKEAMAKHLAAATAAIADATGDGSAEFARGGVARPGRGRSVGRPVRHPRSRRRRDATEIERREAAREAPRDDGHRARHGDARLDAVGGEKESRSVVQGGRRRGRREALESQADADKTKSGTSETASRRRDRFRNHRGHQRQARSTREGSRRW